MKRNLFLLCGFIFSFCATSPYKLLIKIPTRSRPAKILEAIEAFIYFSSKEIPLYFIVSCDIDDITMNNNEMREKLHSFPNLKVFYGNNSNKVEAYNANLEIEDFDILLVASDDVRPVVHGYDKVIIETMKNCFPDLDGILNFNDGNVDGKLNTIPIIGRSFYKRFNYIYHPSYKSFFCDEELTQISKALKKEFISNQVLIKHYHPTWKTAKWDSLYLENEKYWKKDLANFKFRQKNNYFIQNLECPILWSILIPTLESRKEKFNFIYKKLMKQITSLNLENKIEILSFCDNKEYSIGYKRNSLLNKSKGKYICFVDDDDDISEQYIELIYNKLLEDPDCINLIGQITINHKQPKTFIHSLEYHRWYEEKGVYYRPPNHLNAIKRSIATQFKFPEKNFGEDQDWSMQIAKSGLIKTESKINQVLYYYIYMPQKKN